MAGFTLPDNDVAFNADQSRWMSTDLSILTAGLNGVGVVSGCGVTAQGSPDMTVAIAAGSIRVASGTQVAVASGNGTITTADATNPRIDLVSSSDAGTKTVTAGTAAAAPKPPDLPSGHIALAMVYVPANDTTIATNQITDKRVILPADDELDYVETTSDTNITATTEAGATTVVSGSAITYDGSTPVIIEFFSASVEIPATASASIVFCLYDGSSSIGLIDQFRHQNSASLSRRSVVGRRRLTPSAASHTYSIRAFMSSAITGIVYGGSGGSGNYVPAYIRITRV